MIEIIKKNCVGCKKCTKVCPTNILEVIDKKAVVKNGMCLDCGHCQGICPADAILINGEPANKYNVKVKTSFKDIKTLIKTNRSIRKFKDKTVDKKIIDDILRATDFTSSAKNQQPVNWIVVSGNEKVREVSDLSVEFIKKANITPEVLVSIDTFRNPITVDAPNLLIAYAKKNSLCPSIDSTIKVVSAELMMHSAGIGSCHLGYLINFVNNSKELKNYLGLSENEEVYGALGFGYYSKEVYPNIPSRKKADIKYI